MIRIKYLKGIHIYMSFFVPWMSQTLIDVRVRRSPQTTPGSSKTKLGTNEGSL